MHCETPKFLGKKLSKFSEDPFGALLWYVSEVMFNIVNVYISMVYAVLVGILYCARA